MTTPNRRFVGVTALSAEARIESRRLTFPPPVIDLSPNPEAFVFWWRMLQYAFPELVDPCAFPRLPEPLQGPDLIVCRRYVAAAREMAQSALLSADDEMTVHIDDDTGEEHIDAAFTSNEIARGFAVLLRQFDSREERASFQTVYGLLRRTSMRSTDGRATERCDLLDSWKRAQGQLHGIELKRLVRRKVDPNLEFGNDHPPNYYLSAYNYGDLIHWDSNRDVIAFWEADPFYKQHERMAFLEAAAGLAHLYIGFGELVRTALGE